MSVSTADVQEIDTALSRLVVQRSEYQRDLHRLIFGIDQIDMRISRLLEKRPRGASE